jgi:hypothetical protein
MSPTHANITRWRKCWYDGNVSGWIESIGQY